MKILGISCYFHDSASAIIIDGKIHAASQEERFTRIKNDPQFPVKSILSNLKQLNLNPEDIDAVIFYEKPFVKFERILETHISFAPSGIFSFLKSIPLWLSDKLFMKTKLQNELSRIGFKTNVINELKFSDHHLSHAASAFYPSPFEHAIVLVADGVGEWSTTSVFIGNKNSLIKSKEIIFPDSLGLLYSAFTYFCGFKVNSGEYKLMGLAPYGKPVYADIIKKNLILMKDDGSFSLNMDYFNYCVGFTMTNSKFEKLFNLIPRKAESDLTIEYINLASSIQVVLEEALIKIVKNLKNEFQLNHLCMAGGVALNCVANSKILSTSLFDQVWVQPAAGDAGAALGAALALYYEDSNNKREITKDLDMNFGYLGPSFQNEEIEKKLVESQLKFEIFETPELLKKVALNLKNNMSVGWFQGRMEFGPRSLGNRSILANATDPEMQKKLNLKIKFRESFRPFAPIVIAEDVNKYFDFNQNSPYMMFVADVKKEIRYNFTSTNNLKEVINIKKSEIPAVTHIDYSARLQTVSKESNLLLYSLLIEYREITGHSVLVNTSFNVRGEPIVCSPLDAINCFLGTNLDLLVINNYLVKKNENTHLSQIEYSKNFKED